MSVHSKYGPSSRERWRACPGSVRLTEDINPPEESSPEASEGTAAHAEAADCLQNGRDSTNPHIQLYLDYVRSLPGGMMVEETLTHPTLPAFGGTPDCVAFDFGGKLHIVDFKYGDGLVVSADNNPQLEAYAVLAGLKFWEDVEEVTMTIVQPRAPGEPIRSVTVPRSKLVDFDATISCEIMVCESDQATFHSGEHCRWCPVKAHCPVLHADTQLAVGMRNTMPAPESLSDDQITWLLRNEKGIANYLKSVYAHALNRATAGNPVPGWKAIATLGNRQWKNEAETLKAVKRLGKKIDEVAPRMLLSPAQMESSAGVGREWIDIMTERPPGNPRLVPESDPRPGICALDNFEVEEKIDASIPHGE